jgi:hypothetical protein
MSTIESTPSEIMAELQEAARRAAAGVRDPQEMLEAAERMDQMREEIRQREGLLDIAVPAVRELRGDLPAS